MATFSSLPPVLCWLCLCSFVSDLFGCSAGKDRMALSFCHNDSSFFFFSASLSYFKIISPSIPILPATNAAFHPSVFASNICLPPLPLCSFCLDFYIFFLPVSLKFLFLFTFYSVSCTLHLAFYFPLLTTGPLLCYELLNPQQ